ncbi:MAG TPA: S41 family peptidase [Bryobacteraceae bacterium]|nr:S41 family peptidase [Bryobacteraceae bacterium]
MRLRLVLLLAVSTGLLAQTGPVNLDFAKGSPGSPPDGWFVPNAFAGYQATWTTEGCLRGKSCAQIMPKADPGAAPGNLMQAFGAAPYRGKLIRYRAAVNVEDGGHAGLWLRVDRPGGAMGFFDNMYARPIVTAGKWQYFEIDGFVHADADAIALGILVYGAKTHFGDVTLEVTGDLPAATEEPARPLTGAGLRNLTAFAKVLGIVRHFHPSDEAAATDWDRFAVEGVRNVESANSARELAAALQSVFEPVAPTIRIFTGAAPAPHPALSPSGAVEVIRWHNPGVGQNPGIQGNIYVSRRVKAARETWKDSDIFRVDLGASVAALIPLALFADDKGTLPHATVPVKPQPPAPAAAYSANDRATRIADVVIAWNVLRHFYPYFDIAKTDWDAVLPVALQGAAAAQDGAEFQNTLLEMVASLKDGHGRVTYSAMKPQGHAPATAAWIGNKYIVTWSATAELTPGDAIVAINGKPAAAVLEEMEKLISGATPQWKRARSTMEALQCPRGEKLALTIRPLEATETRQVAVSCGFQGPLAMDARPQSVTTELEPGIWYVDLTRATDQDFDKALPQLATAKGIVFDVRGYPKVSPAWFTHVTRTTLHSAQWHVPVVDRPGEMTFERQGEWTLDPQEPYLSAKRAFLTNGGAISYAESTMGIVEYYKLGEILGEATAGTNGNVNPMQLPGGYGITWTGMKVLKHDGSRHHGVGIQPTVPVRPTQAGVAAGRDEVLERAVPLLKQ